MKVLKNFFFVALFAMVAQISNASNLPGIKKSETAQIQAFLKDIEFDKFIDKETKLNISFVINGQNEVIVVSTNNSDLDGVVKNAINYRKISVSNLEYNKIYTVPVIIK